MSTDDEMRRLWRDAGGSFHGPITETGTMPEDKLLPFLRRVARLEGALSALVHAHDDASETIEEWQSWWYADDFRHYLADAKEALGWARARGAVEDTNKETQP